VENQLEFSGKVWHASDLHLGHANILKFSTREEGYEHRFLETWDQLVAPEDAVVLHGDIAFAQKAYWFGQLSERPGHKILLLGNHDQNKLGWYYKWGFERVVPFNEYLLLKYYLGRNGEDAKSEVYEGNIMCTHIPAFPAVITSYDERFVGLAHKFQRAFDHHSCILNIHGHTHGTATEKHNTFDVSLDVVGECLVTTDQIFDHKYRRAA